MERGKYYLIKLSNKRPSMYVIGRLSVFWLSSFMILQAFLSSTILLNSNYLEIFPGQLVFPTVLNAVTALIPAVLALTARQARTTGSKLVVVTVMSLLLVDFSDRLSVLSPLLDAINPLKSSGENSTVVISWLALVLFALVSCTTGWLAFRAQKVMPRLAGNNLSVAVLIVIAVMSLPSVVRASVVLGAIRSQSSIVAPPIGEAKFGSDKPDIYYIVLDRYTSETVLKNQFGFDNSEFVSFLRSSGFIVNPAANSNYPYTTMSISSTLNGIYTNDLVKPYKDDSVQSRTAYHHLIQESSVVKSLKKQGYQYHAVGSWYGASNHNPQANINYMWSNRLTVLGKTITLRDFEGTEFAKSFIFNISAGTFGTQILSQRSLGQVDHIRQQLATLKTISRSDKTGGRFVFAHILVPHDPFFFNADGSLNPNSELDNTGNLNRNKYTAQIQFINTQMRSIIEEIMKNSQGKSVVLINSDEGAYPSAMKTDGVTMTVDYAAAGIDLDDMSTWPDDWLRMKYGILQAAYIPKATPKDLSSLSSVNLFRVVLNSYTNSSLPYLPNCNFALTNNINEFNYVDITQRLQNTAQTECKQYQSLSTNINSTQLSKLTE